MEIEINTTLEQVLSQIGYVSGESICDNQTVELILSQGVLEIDWCSKERGEILIEYNLFLKPCNQTETTKTLLTELLNSLVDNDE